MSKEQSQVVKGNSVGVPVQEFFKFTKEELYNDLKQGHNVIFADGVLYLTPNEIIFNRFIWDIFVDLPSTEAYKKYGGMDIVMDYSITRYYNNGFFSSGSLSGLLERILKDICLKYVEPYLDRTILGDFLFEKLEKVYNDIYNVIVCNGTEYQSSIDILDFYNIQFHPRIIEAIKKVAEEQSEESILNSYKVLDDVIRTTESLRENPVVIGYLSGSFNASQVFQILAPRGYVTEVDSGIIPTPVLSSYFLGLECIASQAKESRAAAKAQFISIRAIEQSEYLARMLQIVTMRMERLVDGECSNPTYFNWYVNPDPSIGKPELPLLAGSWYLDEETGEEKVISVKDTHLIGKTIKIRLPSGCGHPDPGCVCLKCMGRIGYSIPYDTNLGHMLGVFLTQGITQGLLGTKHVTGSAVSISFELGPKEAEFFTKSGKNGLKLKNSNFSKNKTYELYIKEENFKGLRGLVSGMDFNNMASNRLSKIESFHIKVTDNKTGVSTYHDCNVAFTKSAVKKNKVDKNTSNSSKVFGYFTHDFISYVVGESDEKKNYRLDDEGNFYAINLNNWKGKGSIIEFPNLEYNFFQLTKEIRSAVRNLGSEERKVERLIQNLFDLVNVKIDIPLSIISVIASAFVVNDAEAKDVRLARGKKDDIYKLGDIIKYGSLGGTAAFERHAQLFITPNVFNNLNKGYHVLDVALAPDAVIEEHKEGLR